jgi:hypothetical protein
MIKVIYIFELIKTLSMNRIKKPFCIALTLLALQLSSQEQPIHNTYEAPEEQETPKKPYVFGGGALAVVIVVIMARRRRKRRQGKL